MINKNETNFLSVAIKQIQQSKIVVLLQFATILMMVIILMMQMNQRKIITIIDGEGKSITATSGDMTTEVLTRQVRYYSMQSIENYLDLDYRTAVENRNKLKEIMSPDLQQKNFTEKNNIVSNKLLAEAIANRYICTYEWIMMPWVSSFNYPYVTVFGQVRRKITQEGYKPFEEIKNIKLVFRHLKDRPNPFQYPHDLLLTAIEEIDNENNEFKSAINKR
jgi:hypothetical protein